MSMTERNTNRKNEQRSGEYFVVGEGKTGRRYISCLASFVPFPSLLYSANRSLLLCRLLLPQHPLPSTGTSFPKTSREEATAAIRTLHTRARV